MLNANAILSALKESVDYGISSTGGNNDKSKRFKNNVVNKFTILMKKQNKDVKVYIHNTEDIITGYIIYPCDNYEHYENGLPFISQLIYIENSKIRLRAVYSYIDGKAIYSFNEDVVFVKDKYTSNRMAKPPAAKNIVAIEDIRNEALISCVLENEKSTKIISYYSYGLMLYRLIMGDLKTVYGYGLDRNELSEILHFCDLLKIEIKVINGVYRFYKS